MIDLLLSSNEADRKYLEYHKIRRDNSELNNSSLTVMQRIKKVLYLTYFFLWLASGAIMVIFPPVLLVFILLSLPNMVYWFRTGQSYWKSIGEKYDIDFM